MKHSVSLALPRRLSECFTPANGMISRTQFISFIMSDIKLVVSVHDDYSDRLPEVAERLQAAGMQIDQWLVEIGVITGSTSSGNVNSLTQIEGVADVEPSQEYQISPPESDIQ
jgi:hypothetical protein